MADVDADGADDLVIFKSGSGDRPVKWAEASLVSGLDWNLLAPVELIDDFVRGSDDVRVGIVSSDPSSCPDAIPTAVGSTRAPSPLKFTAHPNPFNPRVTLAFVLPASSHVTLTVHDAAGRAVATVLDTELDAGRHAEVWESADAATGVYFLRLVTDMLTETHRVALIR